MIQELTRDYGLLLQVNRKNRHSGKWIVVVCSYSDHAGGPDSRKSISGFVLYLNGIPICYKSKMRATVSLSSSEAEWIALSKAVKKIIFVVQLLRDIGIKVDTPVIVKVVTKLYSLCGYWGQPSAFDLLIVNSISSEG